MHGADAILSAAGMYAVVVFVAAWIIGKILGEKKPLRGALIFTATTTLLAAVIYMATGPAIPISPAIIATVTFFVYTAIAKASYETTWKNAVIIAVGVTVIFIAINMAIASIITTHIASSVNKVQEKSLNVAKKALENMIMGFTAEKVRGLSAENGKIGTIIIYVKLAQNSSTINLEHATLIFSADGGKTYVEYKYGGTAEVLAGKLSPNIPSDKFVIVTNRSTGNSDPYLEQGEIYALAFKLPAGKELKKGQDWRITLRTPYTQDLIVSGYAPEIIMKGEIPLKT